MVNKTDLFPIRPPIIAHRGASAQAPENTLAAFLQAKLCGLNWVEFDVMMAKTGEVVVIHDAELFRTTHHSGCVHEIGYDRLQLLDAGSWFHPRFSQERIPLLDTALNVLYEQELAANIEIKPSLSLRDPLYLVYLEKMVNEICAVLHRHPHYQTIPLLFSSFSLPCLKILRKIAPLANIGILFDSWNDASDWQTQCAKVSPVSLHLNHTMLNPARVAAFKAEQYAVLAYTINDKVRMKELVAWGVDAVFSDCPADFLV